MKKSVCCRACRFFCFSAGISKILLDKCLFFWYTNMRENLRVYDWKNLHFILMHVNIQGRC